MREVGVLEAKTHFSSLVAAAEAGESILIKRHGKVVAKLEPPPAAQRPVGDVRARVEALRAKIAEGAADLPPIDLVAEIAKMRGRD